MKTIYADFNNIDANGVLPLISNGSVESLKEQLDPVAENELVILSDGELWVYAHISTGADGVLEARSDWQFSRQRPSDSDR